MKKMLICVILLSACASHRGRLQMGALHAEIAKASGLDGDPLATTPVEYDQVGKADYDAFFLDSAKINAELIVSKAMVEAMTKNVKGWATSYVAANATDDNVKALVGGRDPKELTNDEALAILKLQKQRGQLGQETLAYATKTGGSALEAATYLTGSVVTTKELVDRGNQLTGRVKTDFTGLDAAKAPAVTTAITTSVSNLTQATATAPEIAKELTRLAQGLMSL